MLNFVPKKWDGPGKRQWTSSTRCNCMYCGSYCYKWHEQICKAAFSRCYICSAYGHYARICNISPVENVKLQPRTSTKKVKSQSRKRRDDKRLKEYKEMRNSICNIFPFADVKTTELIADINSNFHLKQELRTIKEKVNRYRKDKPCTVCPDITKSTNEMIQKLSLEIEDLKQSTSELENQLQVSKSENKEQLKVIKKKDGIIEAYQLGLFISDDCKEKLDSLKMEVTTNVNAYEELTKLHRTLQEENTFLKGDNQWLMDSLQHEQSKSLNVPKQQYRHNNRHQRNHLFRN